MPISLGILIIILIGGGMFFVSNQKKGTPVVNNIVSSETNESVSVEAETLPEHTATPGDLKTTPPSPISTPKISEDSNLVYPNAKKISGDERSFVLESFDESEVITDWYKEKIRNLGMNTKTFVTTKANGKVLNKLVGADGERTVKIEISKEDEQSNVRVSVDIS